MILDLGCGWHLIHKYLDVSNVVHVDIIKTSIVTVQCDAQHLPFKDNMFILVWCSHVLEHVDNPYLVLKEIKRVANGKVIVKVPSGKLDFLTTKHIYTWNPNTLKNLLGKVFLNVKVEKHQKIPYFIRGLIYLLICRLGGCNCLEEIVAEVEL